MKYSDEQIDLFLSTSGVELTPEQKEVFKKCINHRKEDGRLYINMGRYNHRAYFESFVKNMRGEL